MTRRIIGIMVRIDRPLLSAQRKQLPHRSAEFMLRCGRQKSARSGRSLRRSNSTSVVVERDKQELREFDRSIDCLEDSILLIVSCTDNPVADT